MAGEPVARNHTEACRGRNAQKMMEAGDERVLRDIDRMISNEDLKREVIEPPSFPILEDKEDTEAADVGVADAEPLLSAGD